MRIPVTFKLFVTHVFEVEDENDLQSVLDECVTGVYDEWGGFVDEIDVFEVWPAESEDENA